MRIAKIEGTKLVTTLATGGVVILAAAARNHKKQYRWVSSLFGRSGRTHYPTAEKALQAAARQLGAVIEKDEQPEEERARIVSLPDNKQEDLWTPTSSGSATSSH